QPTDDPYVYSGFRAFDQQVGHAFVGNLGIVDQQLFLRPFYKSGQLFSSIRRTDNKRFKLGDVGLTGGISVKQSSGLLDDRRFIGHYTEAASMVDVQIGEIESQQIEDSAVNDHELIVITSKVVGSPCHRYTCFQKPHLELA